MEDLDAHRVAAAIREQTAAFDRLALALLAQAEAVSRLADEAVNLVALLAQSEQAEEDPDAPPTVDMAGRPIREG